MQVEVVLFSRQERFAVTETPILVPVSISKPGLCEIVNHLLEEEHDFDFIIDGKFLKTSISKYMAKNNLSSENVIRIEFVKSIKFGLDQDLQCDDWVASVALNGDSLVSGFFDGSIRCYEGSKLIKSWNVASQVKQVGWYGNDVITCQANSLHYYKDGELMFEAKANGVVQSLAIGKTIATGSWDKNIRLYAVDSSMDFQVSKKQKKQKVEIAQKNSEHAVNCLAFNRETGLLITGHSDSIVRVWDPRANDLLLKSKFIGHKNQISGLKIKSKYSFATVSYDGSLKLWDLRSANPMNSVQIGEIESLSAEKILGCVSFHKKFMFEAFSRRIKVILSTSDLSVVSAKTIRKQIEQEYQVDLSEKKQEFKDFVLELMDQPLQDSMGNLPIKKEIQESKDLELAQQLQLANEPRKTRNEPLRKKRRKEKDPKNSPQNLVQLSPALVSLLNKEIVPRFDVIKLIWEYIKENNLQDPSDKRFVNCDEKLHKVFGVNRVHMFTMNKILAKQMTSIPGTETGEKPKIKKAGKSPFNAPQELSPQLQQVLQVKELSRPQVVSKLWEYIKANNLQDPKDKRNIICDEKLKAVFKVKKVSMFQMNKLLSNHINPKESRGAKVLEDQANTDEDEAEESEAETEESDAEEAVHKEGEEKDALDKDGENKDVIHNDGEEEGVIDEEIGQEEKDEQ